MGDRGWGLGVRKGKGFNAVGAVVSRRSRVEGRAGLIELRAFSYQLRV